MTEGRMTGSPTPLSVIPQTPTSTVSTIPGTSGRMPSTNTTLAGRMPVPEESVEIPKTPWGFVAGLTSNLIGGVVDTVKGLGQLFLVAPIHDTIQLGANLLPGVQAIEKEPSQLATVARTALPGAWFPGADLGGKWGAIASDYAHRYGSPSNLAKGLFEDPLAYIMDALVVADGVGLIAKSGRVGMLAGLPELVSDTAAARILGPALRTPAEVGAEMGRLAPTGEWAKIGRYGEYPYASFSRTASKFENLKLSKNFLVRGAQRGIYNAFSRTPEAAEALTTTARETSVVEAALKYNERLAQVRETAQAAGTDLLYSQPMRILKPVVGKYIANHEMSKVLSALRIRMQAGYQGAIDELRPSIQKMGIDEVTGLEREVDQTLPFRYDQHLAVPEVMPKTDPYQIALEKTLPISPEEAEVLGKGLAPFKPETAAQLVRKYGDQEGGILAYETPYSTLGGRGGSESYSLTVPHVKHAETAGKEALELAGYKNEIKTMETVSRETHPWEGVSMYGKNDAGEVMHISVGTPEMLEAQRNASGAVRRLLGMQDRLKRIETEMGTITDPALAAVKADELLRIQIELRATREFLKHEHFFHSRAVHWADEINPETGKIFGYNPELKQAMSTRVWRSKHVIERWMAESGEEFPFTAMMDRKYVLPRIERLYKVLGDIYPGLKEIADRPALPRLGDAAKYVEATKYLKDMGVPEDVVRRVLASANKAAEGHALPSANILLNRLKEILWDYTVKEGAGGGGFDFHPWDWRTMQEEILSRGEVVPSYLPNLPRVKPSEYMMKGGVPGLGEQKGIFAKDWNKLLFEGAEIPEDINLADALVRASRIVVTHDEMGKFASKMTKEFARDATPEEATAWLKYGDQRYEGEFFFDPDAMLNMIDLRGDLLSKTIMNVPESKDIMEATIKAIDTWKDRVFESATNSMSKGKIKAIPEHVAKMIESEMKNQFGTGVKLFWDTPMKVWKASVLSLSPRWVLNNTVGNLIFVGIENPSALKHVISQSSNKSKALAEALLGVDEYGQDIITAVESGFWHEMENVQGGLEWQATVEGAPTLSKIKNVAMGGGISSERGIARNILHPAVSEAAEDARFSATLAKMNAPSRALQTWSRGVRNFNSAVEEAFRRGILIDELSRAHLTPFGHLLESSTKDLIKLSKEGITPGSYRTALERVDRVIGNFTRYSPMEQNVIRRFFMPFYGFYRHMTNVLLKMPIEHPLKAQLFRNIAQMDAIMKDGIPSYMQNDLPVHLGEILGNDTWLRLRNLNPLSQVTEEFGAVNLLNPGLKLLIERGLGVNTFTGETFDPESIGQGENIVQTNNGEFWEVIRDEEGNILDVQRTGRPLPSLLQHVGSQFGLVSMLPSFSLYPKSVERNIASWAGVSTSQPKNGTASALEYDSEIKQEAMARAIGGSQFGEFGGFSGFGSF